MLMKNISLILQKFLSKFCNFVNGSLFEYETPKFVNIEDKRVGVINKLIQLAILGYIFGFALLYEKGYQDTEDVMGIVTTKVKGATLSHDLSSFSNNCGEDYFGNQTLLDSLDLIIPPILPNSFFVATNIWVTCNQKRGTCKENYEKAVRCNKSTPCEKNAMVHGGNGALNGVCNEIGTCDIHGWCPVQTFNGTEFWNPPANIDTKNFTVYVKNSIFFPRLKPEFKRRNFPSSASKDFLANCLYSETEEDSRECPIFTLKQIVDLHNPEEGFYDKLATTGGVIGLQIEWDCNLNTHPENCKPVYSARRLDDPTSNVSQGFNFRLPRYYKIDGVEYRDHWTIYGIWFVIEIVGQGGKFSFTQIALVLGSTIGLLAIATVVTDIIALHLLREGKYYKEKKFQQVKKNDRQANKKDQEAIKLESSSIEHLENKLENNRSASSSVLYRAWDKELEL